MDHQQRTQQTENIIVEMLEFLDSSSEEGDDLEKFVKSQTHDEQQTVKKDFNDNIISVEMKTSSNIQNKSNGSMKKSKSIIIKELKKLKQQFPIWNTKEIAPFNKPIYDKVSSSILNITNGAAESDISTSVEENLDWYVKLETNCRRSSISNSYIREIQKAIYGDRTKHPPSGSVEYYQAAQNYLDSLLNEKNTYAYENINLTNLYPMSQGFGAVCPSGNNNIGKSNTTTTIGASTPAYYQLGNGIQAQSRPTIYNNSVNSSTYGILLGNKVTYVATTPSAPSLIYNQHNKTATNFISNSLANATLATSPTILYSNPMLTTTATQQYLNTFFKETQFLGAGLTANSTQTAMLGSNSTTGIYERLIYAQMLQQQLYYQTQQAAAVAAMFQYKQRAAAAVALAAINRQSNSVTVATNVSRISPQHITAITTTTNCIGSASNSSNNQVINGSSTDILKTNQQSSTANNSIAITASGNVSIVNE